MKRMHTDEEIQKLAASPIGDVSIDGDLAVDGNFEATGAIIPGKAEYENASDTYSLPTGFAIQTGRVPYTAIKVIGGFLWLIAQVSVTNNSGTNWSGAFSIFYNVTLPEKYAKRIYRDDGTTCDKAYTSSNLVLYANGLQGGTTKSIVVTSAAANKLNVYFDGANVNNGSNATYSARIPILLI